MKEDKSQMHSKPLGSSAHVNSPDGKQLHSNLSIKAENGSTREMKDIHPSSSGTRSEYLKSRDFASPFTSLKQLKRNWKKKTCFIFPKPR